MNAKEYEAIQRRLSELMDSKRLYSIGIRTAGRKDGYKEGVLAVKSMLSREFKPLENSNEP